VFDQARSQVSIFGGAQYIFEGARFYYMLKTNFSGRNKIWGHKRNLGGTVPECPPGLRVCVWHFYRGI